MTNHDIQMFKLEDDICIVCTPTLYIVQEYIVLFLYFIFSIFIHIIVTFTSQSKQYKNI